MRYSRARPQPGSKITNLGWMRYSGTEKAQAAEKMEMHASRSERGAIGGRVVRKVGKKIPRHIAR
eukprot:15338714-Alexandrium_andersonii.AAC.1